jgi:uncharacterized protein YbjT (DUF2867 family)
MILITGARGNNGVEIIKQLSGKGVAVHGMVRKKEDAKSEAGVDYVAADFNDVASLRRALEGIDHVFLVTNSSERVEEQQLQFVETAKEMGVQHIVYLSQFHAAKDSPLRFLRYHALVEEALKNSGMMVTVLRPNLYMQALMRIFAPQIAKEGRFFAPAGEARVSVVDVRDIAAVAVAALTEEGHAGKTYDVTGPEALSHEDMATQLTKTLGKQVDYVDISEKTLREALAGFGMPEWQAEGLIEDYAHYHRGEAAGVSSAVKDVTGKAARSFAEFAKDYKESLLKVG